MGNTVAFLVTGAEVLDGRVHEGNAHYAAQSLTRAGITLAQVCYCGDSEHEIVRSLRFLLQNASAVVVSGGIGPTTDDLTREAVSALTECELELDPPTLERLKERYRARHRTFEPSNIKQALFPRGAKIIPNTKGTAAGFESNYNVALTETKSIFVLPGVPLEFQAMFEEQVLPELLQRFGGTSTRSQIGFRVFGLPESVIGSRVSAVVTTPAVTVGYRAAFPEVHVSFSGSDTPQLMKAHAAAQKAVGESFVVSQSLGEGLSHGTHELLVAAATSVAIGEVESGGQVTALLTRVSSPTPYLKGAVIYGIEVSAPPTRESALTIAQAVRKQLGAALGISLRSTHSGSFFVGIADDSGDQAYHFFYPAEKSRAREYQSHMVLDVVRRTLLGVPIIAHEEGGA